MDKCHYCGTEYHPMPMYSLSEDRSKWRVTTPHYITVCHLRIIEDVIKEDGGPKIDQTWRGCAEKAKADGYEHRPDLTPKR